jgi:hypothetical protein
VIMSENTRNNWWYLCISVRGCPCLRIVTVVDAKERDFSAFVEVRRSSSGRG